MVDDGTYVESRLLVGHCEYGDSQSALASHKQKRGEKEEGV